MGNGMNKIMPGIYIGNYRDSKDYAQLERYNITHILSVHDTARKLYPDKHYLCILVEDNPDQNLSQYFSQCNDFIHAARLRNGSVLIHCLAGMSRSVTVAVAYIMSVTNLNWKEALKVVRVNRAVANPNSGFQKQLQEFENTRITEERKRLRERFPSVALLSIDEDHCSQTLQNYQRLIVTKKICEGNCSRIQRCPTGICNFRMNVKQKRKHSIDTNKLKDNGNCSFKPHELRRSLLKRPQSGPPILVTYGESAPPSRSASSQDLSDMVEFKKYQSAPVTPQQSPQRKQVTNVTAPLVDLNEDM